MRPRVAPGSATGSGPAGLSREEAARRLATEGPNELPHFRRGGALRLLAEIVSEPLILLLVAAGVVYLALGELRDSVLLIASVFVIIAIELYQDYRSERALEALRSLADPHVVVLRDGRPVEIPSREVVRDDVVVLSEGGRVPADAWVVHAAGLSVDESLLTGESVPVSKRPWNGRDPWGRPGGDGRPQVYAQTLVVRGRGLARVRATGTGMEVSHIAEALGSVEVEVPLLRAQTRGLVRGMAVAAFVLCLVVAVVEGWRSSDWASGLLAGIALAISLIPEEMPVVLTIYTALGARRMSQERVLTRRFGAIATLGATTVLCVDKTGTLTENRMRVVTLARPGETHPADSPATPPAVAESIWVGSLACPPHPTDPTDQAFVELARAAFPSRRPMDESDLLREYPLTSDLWAVVLAWRLADGSSIVAAKGAPETIFGLCGLTPDARVQWMATVREMTDRGQRVLAVAERRGPVDGIPATIPEIRFSLLGLVGLEDPLRVEVPSAIRECRDAGIRVVMITGDHAGTARAVARQAGFPRPEAVLTGPELAALDARTLGRRVAATDIYARVAPHEKLQLVEALKGRGEIVAMTGDGVNDAPALQAAHIGIAMGRRGTDVARAAASLVLLDDDFPTMVRAVREGRRIYANMQKAFAYLIAIHVAIAGVALFPVLLGLPLVLFPVQIVFLELLVDPTSSIAFEGDPAEPGLMRRPPRAPTLPLVPWRLGVDSFIAGAMVVVAAVGFYSVIGDAGLAPAASRALAFVTLVVGNTTLMLVMRAGRGGFLASLRLGNPIVAILAVGTAAGLVALLGVPLVAETFRFVAPPIPLLLVAVGLGAAAALWQEPFKWWRRRHVAPRRGPGGGRSEIPDGEGQPAGPA